MSPDARVFVAGSGTVGGRAILDLLMARAVAQAVGDAELVLDLRDGAAVRALFADLRPTAVVYAGASEAGIAGNLTRPAGLMTHNLLAQASVLGAAQQHGVRRLLYLASSCVYPRDCPQPMGPDRLFTGPVEPSSEPYAVARLAGLVLCRAVRAEHGLPWIGAIPANLFGPGDSLDPRDAHVVAALMRRCWSAQREGAREVVVWGSGAARRDFLFAPDLADAALFLLERYHAEPPMNIGSGQGVTIAELAGLIRELTGFGGQLRFDATKPDGAPDKRLDSTPIHALGWHAPTPLADALERTWTWVRDQLDGSAA